MPNGPTALAGTWLRTPAAGSPLPWHRLRPLACAVVVSALAVAGCTSDEPAAPPALPYIGQQVALLVVDDPELAQAIRLLQGEWSARSGAKLTIEECTAQQLEARCLAAASPTLGADAAIVPAGLLGLLAERGLVEPLPPELLQHPDLQWDDIFEGLRRRDASWGGKPYAIPLGSPVLALYYRTDIFARAGLQPPQTWSEYQALAATLAQRPARHNADSQADPAAPRATWYGAAEPTAPPWAAVTFLARAAAYARHPDYFNALFDLETMQPRLESPPFVRALQEMAAAARYGPAELTPDEVRAAFLRGETAMAIAWPMPALISEALEASAPASSAGASGAARGAELPQEPLRMAMADLPGSFEAYHPKSGEFETLSTGSSAVRRVPLLGFAGRLGVVARRAGSPQAAYQLLVSLVDRNWGVRIATRSRATTAFRYAHLYRPQDWVAPAETAAAGDYLQRSVRHDDGSTETIPGVLLRAYEQQEYVFAIRIPGREQYLAALDQAVREALRGEKQPAEALRAASAAWEAITDRLGRAQQLAAYRRSVVRLH
jgi:multiple sugar transport system substrate-binding protein